MRTFRYKFKMERCNKYTAGPQPTLLDWLPFSFSFYCTVNRRGLKTCWKCWGLFWCFTIFYPRFNTLCSKALTKKTDQSLQRNSSFLLQLHYIFINGVSSTNEQNFDSGPKERGKERSEGVTKRYEREREGQVWWRGRSRPQEGAGPTSKTWSSYWTELPKIL